MHRFECMVLNELLQVDYQTSSIEIFKNIGKHSNSVNSENEWRCFLTRYDHGTVSRMLKFFHSNTLNHVYIRNPGEILYCARCWYLLGSHIIVKTYVVTNNLFNVLQSIIFEDSYVPRTMPLENTNKNQIYSVGKYVSQYGIDLWDFMSLGIPATEL